MKRLLEQAPNPSIERQPQASEACLWLPLMSNVRCLRLARVAGINIVMSNSDGRQTANYPEGQKRI